LYEKASAIHDSESKKKFPLLWIIIGILILIFIGALLYVLWGRGIFNKGDATSSATTGASVNTEAESEETVPEEPRPELPKEVPVITAPPVQAAPAPTPAAPVRPAPSRARPETSGNSVADSRYTVPETIPENGVAYKIRWGDTLWDISEAYYRNPWLYPRIARFNGIRNPDRIISGNTIRIPPKN
jgi:nucleoid-associated protein YgaU